MPLKGIAMFSFAVCVASLSPEFAELNHLHLHAKQGNIDFIFSPPLTDVLFPCESELLKMLLNLSWSS